MLRRTTALLFLSGFATACLEVGTGDGKDEAEISDTGEEVFLSQKVKTLNPMRFQMIPQWIQVAREQIL